MYRLFLYTSYPFPHPIEIFNKIYLTKKNDKEKYCKFH